MIIVMLAIAGRGTRHAAACEFMNDVCEPENMAQIVDSVNYMSPA